LTIRSRADIDAYADERTTEAASGGREVTNLGGPAAGVHLTVPAEPSNVPLVRQVLAGLLDAHDVDPALCADMKIAVTEACTNVVVHAYPDGNGPLETTMTMLPGNLVVSVRDRGLHFKPLPSDPGSTPLGFGLALIASLSDEFGIRSGTSGTEVQMMFGIGDQPLADANQVFAQTSQLKDSPSFPPEGIVLSLTPDAPLVGVLGRVVSLLAVRADFSIDRLSDAQLVSDALATHAPRRAANGVVRIAVSETDTGFALRVWPLEADGGRALVSDTTLPGLGSLLERLSNELAYEPVADPRPGTEALLLRMSREA
jgi:anti-sigma regulatory factor (Ser/Thr protein kinase)